MKRLAVSALALCAGLAASTTVWAAPRVTTSLSEDWRFLQADPAGAERADADDSGWTRVTTPHDWAIAGPFDEKAKGAGENGFLPTGVAWYRKALDIKPAQGRRYFVEFDGIMERSKVFVNGQLVGERPMGYVSLRYDITPYLRADGKNVVAVRADTSAAPSSRWYNGSGIYRQVRLIETSDVFIPQGGAYVTTPTITADGATVAVATDVANAAAGARGVKMEVVITGPDGREVARTTTPVSTVAAGKTETVRGEVRLASPRRWDIKDPALYRAAIRVLGEDGAVLDNDTVRFGVREARFDPATGFWLNGRNFKLKGVALHHDGGAVGAAVPKDVWRQRMSTLKAEGVNAIRTAHNVPSPEMLDVADELGLLVMDEFFDQWLVGKTPEDYSHFFAEWHERDTRDMVRRDRNHPSIILWSIGNEIHDTPNEASAKASLKSIIDVVHANDSTRPVTQALFRPNVSHDYDNGLADMLDVVGQNYRENELIAANKQNPKRSIVGTENQHGSGPWVMVRDYAPYSGMFLWTGVDYLGEANRSGWPNIGSGSGLLDRTGAQKVRGMERESWWNEKPVVYVVRNSGGGAPRPEVVDPGYPNLTAAPAPTPAPAAPTPRAGRGGPFHDWTPANLAPHPENLEVYSNCQSVEAFLNGKSLGAKPINQDATPRRWSVQFAPGEVRAVCRDAGATNVADTLRTAGPAAAVVLEADKPAVGSSFDDLAFVRARVVDAKGVTVPGADPLVHFKVTGPGVIVATDNGSNTDHTPFPSHDRKANAGTVVALVRGAGAGSIRVEAAADGLKTGTATLRATN
jgi:beta-galactosidase